MEPVAKPVRLATVRETRSPPEPTPENSVNITRLEIYKAIASVIAASAAVLATRVLLLLALIGGFILALIAVQSTSVMALCVLCAYAVLIVMPLVFLETRTRWTGG